MSEMSPNAKGPAPARRTSETVAVSESEPEQEEPWALTVEQRDGYRVFLDSQVRALPPVLRVRVASTNANHVLLTAELCD